MSTDDFIKSLDRGDAKPALEQYLSGECIPQVEPSLYDSFRDEIQEEIDRVYDNLQRENGRYILSGRDKDNIKEGFAPLKGIQKTIMETQGREFLNNRYGEDNIRTYTGQLFTMVYIHFISEKLE